MRNAIATIVLFVVFVTLLSGKALATIYEDDPRWNCRTMGNYVCGIDPVFSTRSITIDGKLYV